MALNCTKKKKKKQIHNHIRRKVKYFRALYKNNLERTSAFQTLDWSQADSPACICEATAPPFGHDGACVSLPGPGTGQKKNESRCFILWIIDLVPKRMPQLAPWVSLFATGPSWRGRCGASFQRREVSPWRLIDYQFVDNERTTCPLRTGEVCQEGMVITIN